MDLGGGTEAKIKLFQNMVMLHIKLKLTTLAAKMVANILPTDTLSTLGVGSKGQNIFFLKVVMLHIKLKLTTLAATW